MPSRFPEAFGERFEQTYPVKGYDTLQEYLHVFEEWQGYRSTTKQRRAFYIECDLKGYFPAPIQITTKEARTEEERFNTKVNVLFTRIESDRVSSRGKKFKVTQWRNKKTGRFSKNPYSTYA